MYKALKEEEGKIFFLQSKIENNISTIKSARNKCFEKAMKKYENAHKIATTQVIIKKKTYEKNKENFKDIHKIAGETFQKMKKRKTNKMWLIWSVILINE